jgi:hypothetical protein
MSEQSSPPAANSFQRYHVLSSDEDEYEDGNVVLTSPSYELGGLVSNASMHSTGGHSASSSPDRLPQQLQKQQQQQFPRNNPVKSFEEIRSVASSNKSVASGSGSRSHRTGNSASLPNSPLNSLTKSAASHDDSDEDEHNDGPGDNSREKDRDLGGGGGGGGIGKMSWNDDEDFDDDLSDDDDEAGLRRYHFTQANTLPAEFDNASTWKRITTYLLEVRMAARQRRAHRLLSMSGTHMDSPAQRCRLCFMTHCWDATDRGILLLIVSVFAWLVVGFVLHLGERWWYAGLLLLLVRIMARPTYESLFVRRQPFALSTPAVSSARASSSSSAAAGGFGRIPSSSASTTASLELGTSSHHRTLARPGRSRSPSPKPRGMV